MAHPIPTPHRPSRRHCLNGAVAAGLALCLTGCGFRLRGAMQLPFASLRTNLSETSPLGRELVQQLRANGVRVFTPRDAAPPGQAVDVVLEVLNEQRERAVVGRTATGQVRELQLRQRLTFRVRSGRGKDLIADTELQQDRDLSFSEDQALAKEMEEQLLYRDMQDDIVRQLMRRLAALREP